MDHRFGDGASADLREAVDYYASCSPEHSDQAALGEEWRAEIVCRSDAVRDGLETTQSAEEFEAEMRSYLAEMRSGKSTE